MMWFKVTGALLILTAAASWGNQQAARLRRRQKELDEFRLALRLLRAEIGYTSTPLPRALECVAERLRLSRVALFFSGVEQALRDTAHPADATAAWYEAIVCARERLELTAQDWSVLRRAAAGLGGLGREDQVLQLEAAEQQLAAHAAEAAERCAGGEKMWRYLGVMGGLALVILLL